ncbi:hypothetical protein PENSPDRAFT_650475 [Peniophora sp. CONT]|nr:hypothetical protein PENSPDRAFT_650475 [Peniophora sp. CONT]
MLLKHTTIDDVHDDILSLIFDELARLDPPRWLRDAYRDNLLSPHPDPSRRCYSLGWMVTTHVCERWRKILLSMSPLWAAIVCNLSKAFEALLDRARHAPLTVYIPTYNPEPQERMKFILEVALSHISDTRSLRCSIPAGSQHDHARGVLSSGTLPHLRHLGLDFGYKRGKNSHRFKERLRLDAPNLEITSLSGIRCHLTSLHLRSLEITKFGLCEQNGLEYFLQLLQNAPELEDLLFEVDCGPLAIANSCLESHVHLAHLKRLCACGHFRGDNLLRNANAIFGRLIIPLQCSIHYMVTAHDLQTGWQAASDALGHRLRQRPYNAASFTSHMSVYERNFDVSAFYTHECPASFGQFPAPYTNEACCDSIFYKPETPQPPTPGVRLGASTGSAAREWPCDMLFANAISYLDHKAITHLALNLDSSGGTDESTIYAALCSLSAVEVLFIVNVDDDPWMLRAFAAENATGALLPRLRELIIGKMEPQTNWDAQEYESWWKALLYMLKHRDDIGSPVRTLRLTGTWDRSNNIVAGRNTDNVNALRVRDMGLEFCDERVWLEEQRLTSVDSVAVP